MQKRKCYYKILEVSRRASEREIILAYRKLSLQYHPDKNPNNQEAEEKFREIVEAYNVLKDKKKRFLYNVFGHGAYYKDKSLKLSAFISRHKGAAFFLESLFITSCVTLILYKKTSMSLLRCFLLSAAFYTAFFILTVCAITVVNLIKENKKSNRKNEPINLFTKEDAARKKVIEEKLNDLLNLLFRRDINILLETVKIEILIGKEKAKVLIKDLIHYVPLDVHGVQGNYSNLDVLVSNFMEKNDICPTKRKSVEVFAKSFSEKTAEILRHDLNMQDQSSSCSSEHDPSTFCDVSSDEENESASVQSFNKDRLETSRNTQEGF